jgi:hypothetical protein
VVEQHKPHSKQVNSSAVNYEVRYAPHGYLLLPVHKNKFILVYLGFGANILGYIVFYIFF